MFGFTKTKHGSSKFLYSVVIEVLTSLTGAIAEMIPVIGLLTVKFDWSFSQVVLMDKESLPTGIAIPRSIQKFDNASTPFLRFKSSIFSPHAAIQLADALIEEIDSIGTDIILVTASATAIRIEAAAL